jgi:Ceramidase
MADRDLRPLAVTAAVAVASVGLLALAIGQGWLGPDVGRGDMFCEAARDGFLVQPANSLSNLGFVVAGLLVAWRAGRADQLGDVLPRLPGLATAYAVITVLLGPASAAMHATQSALGGHLDLLSMYLIASFAAAYGLVRLLRRGVTFFFQVFLLLVAACELVGTLPAEVPVVHVTGNLAFGILLISAVVMEILLWRRADGTRTDLRFGAASLGAMLVAFVIWNLAQGPWCDPHSLIQGHAAWHLLDAVAAYLLFLLYASERVTNELRSVAVGSQSLPSVDR